MHGTANLEAVSLANVDTGDTEKLPGAALFIFIGADAATEWLPAEIARTVAAEGRVDVAAASRTLSDGSLAICVDIGPTSDARTAPNKPRPMPHDRARGS